MNDIPSKTIEILALLNELEKEILLKNHKRISIEAGATIIKEGDTHSNPPFYIILSGDIEVKKILSDRNYNREILINILRSGDSFGEIAILLENKTRTATLRALTDLVLLEISRESFEYLYNNSITFVQILHRITIESLKFSNILTTYAMLSAKKHLYKLSYLLNFLVYKYGKFEDNSVEINLPFNVGTIADFLGVVRQQFNRTKKVLKDKGLVSGYGRIIIIPDYQKFIQFLKG